MMVAVSEPYLQLIRSDRVGANTRNALLERTKSDSRDYQPIALTEAHITTLRSVLDRVLPQKDENFIDLAARIDHHLSVGTDDGWRRTELPSDIESYKLGLDLLAGIATAKYQRHFSDLDALQQDEVLTGIVAGDLPTVDPGAIALLFSAWQLQLWFEDLRADAIRLYVAHPATLERMGYSGIANGGDGQSKSGFVQVGLGQREVWEPLRKP